MYKLNKLYPILTYKNSFFRGPSRPTTTIP